MSTTALTAVLAKFAGLNFAAKTAVGIAVATGAVGAAAGVPLAVAEITTDQETVVVQDVADEPADDLLDEGTEPADGEATEPAEDDGETAEPAEGEDDTAEPGWEEYENFGAWVRTQAREGGVDGQEVAAAAHERNQVRAEERVQARVGDDEDGEASEDAEQTQDRDRDQLKDGSCDSDCDGDQSQDQDRDRDGADEAPGNSGKAPGHQD